MILGIVVNVARLAFSSFHPSFHLLLAPPPHSRCPSRPYTWIKEICDQNKIKYNKMNKKNVNSVKAMCTGLVYTMINMLFLFSRMFCFFVLFCLFVFFFAFCFQLIALPRSLSWFSCCKIFILYFSISTFTSGVCFLSLHFYPQHHLP